MVALKEGYAKAYSAIIDANITTLLTAFVLYSFGSGAIRGFATTLIIFVIWFGVYIHLTIFSGVVIIFNLFIIDIIFELGWFWLRFGFFLLFCFWYSWFVKYFINFVCNDF